MGLVVLEKTIDDTWPNLFGQVTRVIGVHHRWSNPEYVIYAIADLKNNKDSSQYDAWAINHRKVLQQAQDGVN